MGESSLVGEKSIQYIGIHLANFSVARNTLLKPELQKKKKKKKQHQSLYKQVVTTNTSKHHYRGYEKRGMEHMDGHINARHLRLPHRHMGRARTLTGWIRLPEVGPARFNGVHG